MIRTFSTEKNFDKQRLQDTGVQDFEIPLCQAGTLLQVPLQITRPAVDYGMLKW